MNDSGGQTLRYARLKYKLRFLFIYLLKLLFVCFGLVIDFLALSQQPNREV